MSTPSFQDVIKQKYKTLAEESPINFPLLYNFLSLLESPFHKLNWERVFLNCIILGIKTKLEKILGKDLSSIIYLDESSEEQIVNFSQLKLIISEENSEIKSLIYELILLTPEYKNKDENYYEIACGYIKLILDREITENKSIEEHSKKIISDLLNRIFKDIESCGGEFSKQAAEAFLALYDNCNEVQQKVLDNLIEPIRLQWVEQAKPYVQPTEKIACINTNSFIAAIREFAETDIERFRNCFIKPKAEKRDREEEKSGEPSVKRIEDKEEIYIPTAKKPAPTELSESSDKNQKLESTSTNKTPLLPKSLTSTRSSTLTPPLSRSPTPTPSL